MSTATGQRGRPQLSVRNRAMASTTAFHDHDIFAREEPVHSVIQTTVQRVVILGFQNGPRDLWISTNVFPQPSVVVGIIKLSAVDGPYRRTVAHSRVVVLETANKLVVVFPCVEFLMRSPEFMTTMRRPRRLFKIRKPTVHNNRISLKHIPRNLPTADTDHRMCETMGEI